MVSIDRSIIRRIKNGRDLVTYRGVLVPAYSRGRTVAKSKRLK